jgi:hypothetical protein
MFWMQSFWWYIKINQVYKILIVFDIFASILKSIFTNDFDYVL